MSPKHQLGENLRRIRKSKKLTQAELAQQLYVSTQAISKWERGESEPGVNYIRELSRILNISSDALLGIQPASAPALLAVDGGGTKTEFILISPEGNLLKRILLPGTNPNSSTMEQSFRTLCHGIDQMLQSDRQIIGVYIGCAGMGSGNNGAIMTDMLRKQYPGIPLRCVSDIYNILACAKDPNNAIAVISGTGSVVYATADGKLIRAGGGGWQLDPLGSGYELGRAALSAALAHSDGTGPKTSITKAVEKELGDSVWNSISKIYTLSPGQISDFAPIVASSWECGDPVAGQIVNANVKRLAELIQFAYKKAPKTKEIIFSGSLLTNCAAFRRELIKLLPENIPTTLIGYPPVWGACLQCARMCHLPIPSLDVFMQQYSPEVL